MLQVYSDKVRIVIKMQIMCASSSVYFNSICRPQSSHNASYENMDNLQPELELHTLGSMLMEPSGNAESERTPLDARQRRPSMKHLVRQASTVNTQKAEGHMKLTYWF